MELLLKRIARKKRYTIGHLYVNGAYVCDTIEDEDRFFFGREKIRNKTAIPCGKYEIVQHIFSPRFGNRQFYMDLCGGYLPRLLNVAQFDGVLMHCGNSADDSSGCIIVGKNKLVGRVLESQATFTKIMQQYLLPAKERGEKVFITIK